MQLDPEHLFGPRGALFARLAPRLQQFSLSNANLTDPALAYYALYCRAMLLAATAKTALADVEWQYPSLAPATAWLDELADQLFLNELSDTAAAWIAAALSAAQLVDPFRPVYAQLVSAAARRKAGEFYTPLWLSEHVIARDWAPDLQWLDPSAGGGAFALALANVARKRGGSATFTGIEANPLAALGLAANVALARRFCAGANVANFPLPIACFDLTACSAPPQLASGFDRIIGNPPWVLWDRLSPDYRAQTAALWRHYGLLVETGMAGILGGGKKDLAMLITYVAADRYLRPGGKLGFVLTQSVLKSAGSARGFRRFTLPDGIPLAVEHVDDLSALRPFAEVSNKTIVLIVAKGRPTRFPVPYHVWSGDPQTASDQIVAKQLAQPSGDDALSAWRHYDPATADRLASVLGPCDYQAHLGVNTGGANGIYWFEKLAELPGGLWRMRNLARRSKLPIETIEVDLESEYLFPLLIGRDVRAWRAEPSAWVLLVQDPKRRRGIDPDLLRQRAPRTLQYLLGFEDRLRARAAFKRYYQRPTKVGVADAGPCYSMFDVGGYSLAPVKVVWNRMGHKLAAAVVAASVERRSASSITTRSAVPHCVGKPIQPQETHAYFAVAGEDEGHYLAALLNSGLAQQAMETFAQTGGKSFATPRSIHQLRLPRFDPAKAIHQQLAECSRAFHDLAAGPDLPLSDFQMRIDDLARRLWSCAK